MLIISDTFQFPGLIKSSNSEISKINTNKEFRGYGFGTAIPTWFFLIQKIILIDGFKLGVSSLYCLMRSTGSESCDTEYSSILIAIRKLCKIDGGVIVVQQGL
jgi:hypothetical protein